MTTPALGMNIAQPENISTNTSLLYWTYQYFYRPLNFYLTELSTRFFQVLLKPQGLVSIRNSSGG